MHPLLASTILGKKSLTRFSPVFGQQPSFIDGKDSARVYTLWSTSSTSSLLRERTLKVRSRETGTTNLYLCEKGTDITIL